MIDRFYQRYVPLADDLYDAYMDELRQERIAQVSGHRPFAELTKDWSETRRQEADRRTNELLLDIEQAALADLRKALHISQESLAKTMGKSQAAVAQMEQRTDMKVRTLREAIEAMGGELELVAHFPTGDVRIIDLGDAAE